MTTEQIALLPPAVSADGKRNAFYTDCRPLQVKKPYAMCQHIIDHVNDSSLQVTYSDCLNEIRQGRCTATAMRDEEKLKGQAIYFVERVKGAAVVAQQEAWAPPVRSRSRSGYQRDKYAAPSAATPASQAAAPVFDGNIYAAALNIAAKRSSTHATNGQSTHASPEPVAIAPAPETSAPKAAAAPRINLNVRAGESPLEMARRLRAAQQEQA